MITDSVKFMQTDVQGQKLVAPEGHRQVTGSLQSQDGSRKSESGRGKTKSNVSHFRPLVSDVTSCVIRARKNRFL